MKTLTQAPAEIEAFPENRIRDYITAWREEDVKKRESDPFAPKERLGTLYRVLPSIDSLAVLDSLITIEEILDQKVPACFIKPGGYESTDDMFEHLIPQLRKLHEEKHRR